jgi:hypothetical protein
MLLVLGLLKVAREVEHLIPVLSNKCTFQRDDAGGICVIDAMTSLAELLMGLCRWPLHPLPTPFVIDRATSLTSRGLMKLTPQLIRVVDPLVLSAA